MKRMNVLQMLIFSIVILFCGTACDNENDERFSSTEEFTVEGDANSIEIPMTRTNWIVASVMYPDGGIMTDENGYPLKLEGMGTVRFHWGSITRDKAKSLIIHLNDNFAGEERKLIIKLSTEQGLYSEQIFIQQKVCTNYYQIESISYYLDEFDGVREAGTEPWGITWIDRTGSGEEIKKTTVFPFYNAFTEYYFGTNTGEYPKEWMNPEGKSRLVDMPGSIVDGQIILEQEKQIYTDRGMYRGELKDISFEKDLVSMKQNRYYADVYYKALQVSYTMTLSRPGSDTKKIITGKLLKKYPYDCSPIQHAVSDLPPEDA